MIERYYNLLYTRTYKRTNVDAHFVLALGAKVNSYKRRVSVVYTNWREG